MRKLFRMLKMRKKLSNASQEPSGTKTTGKTVPFDPDWVANEWRRMRARIPAGTDQVKIEYALGLFTAGVAATAKVIHDGLKGGPEDLAVALEKTTLFMHFSSLRTAEFLEQMEKARSEEGGTDG